MSEIVELIRLNRIKETPYFKDLTDDAIVEEVKEILIRFDIHFQHLGVEYNHLNKIGRWDPDANYTPCEHQIHVLAKLFGLDYNKDIAEEAYRRIKAWDKRLEEVHKQRANLVEPEGWRGLLG